MKRTAFTENLYKNAGYYVVVLISLIYIASSLVLISKTGKSIYEIIGTGFLSLVVGSLINGSFRNIGIRRGEDDERTISTIELHSSAVEEIVPYLDKLDEYCERENALAIKRLRIRLLANVGLKYDDCFDENGVVRELNLTQGKENRAKRKAYRQAIRLKIKALTPSSLTSDGGDFNNPFNFGKSKREYTRQRSTADILSRIVMAIIFGFFGVSLVSEINFAVIIWNSLQIIMYVTSGVIGMYSTYMWIVDDYRQSVIKKIDHLQRFKIYASSQH